MLMMKGERGGVGGQYNFPPKFAECSTISFDSE